MNSLIIIHQYLQQTKKNDCGEPGYGKGICCGRSKGYKYAINQPKEAADILLEAAPDLDKELVRKSQEWLADKYQDDAAQWGEQKLAVWRNYADWMTSNNVLEGEFNPAKAFTNDFFYQLRRQSKWQIH